jgi:hypothetical protein
MGDFPAWTLDNWRVSFVITVMSAYRIPQVFGKNLGSAYSKRVAAVKELWRDHDFRIA